MQTKRAHKTSNQVNKASQKSKKASKQANKRASKQASKQARKQTSKQTSKQANKQTDNYANKQTNGQSKQSKQRQWKSTDMHNQSKKKLFISVVLFHRPAFLRMPYLCLPMIISTLFQAYRGYKYFPFFLTNKYGASSQYAVKSLIDIGLPSRASNWSAEHPQLEGTSTGFVKPPSTPLSTETDFAALCL